MVVMAIGIPLTEEKCEKMKNTGNAARQHSMILWGVELAKKKKKKENEYVSVIIVSGHDFRPAVERKRL